MGPFSSVIRQSLRDKGTLNVLTSPTHEGHAYTMKDLPHTFYLFRAPNIKDWNPKYRPLPPNHILLNPDRGHNQIPPYVEIDVCLSQNTVGQYQVFRQYADANQLPLISLEHCIVTPGITPSQVRQRRRHLRADLHVFISEVSCIEWGYDPGGADVVILHHGVNTDLFKPSTKVPKNIIGVAVNDFINRGNILGYKEFREATQGMPLKVIGDTPGLSRPAADFNELVEFYQNISVFLNTSVYSPIPSVVLEAAASGCAVVSTDHCMLKDIFTHEVDVLFANDGPTMRRYCSYLLANPEQARTLGANARQTIIEKFPLDGFLKKWDEVLHKVL